MVNLTRIYTRTGDAGETRLGDMSTTTKTDLRLQAYATVDEANAHLGVALATGGLEDDVVAVLTHVQNDLFDVGADFSIKALACCSDGDMPTMSTDCELARPRNSSTSDLRRVASIARCVISSSRSILNGFSM